jgi:poly(3-hydroxyalkanoate) synthetase
MKTEPRGPQGREDATPVLNATIEVLDLAGKNLSIAPAESFFATVNTLLKIIGVRFLLLYNGLLQIHILHRKITQPPVVTQDSGRWYLGASPGTWHHDKKCCRWISSPIKGYGAPDALGPPSLGHGLKMVSSP